MTMWVIATFVAFFVKGVCGFANTLVFTSILSYGTANVNISPTELLIGYPMNLLMTWKGIKDKSLAAIIFTRIVWQYSGSFYFEERRCGHYKSIFRDCSVGAGSSDVSAGISA